MISIKLQNHFQYGKQYFGVSIPWLLLVLIELFLRSVNDNDDDDFGGGKGVRVGDMQPAYVPSGA